MEVHFTCKSNLVCESYNLRVLDIGFSNSGGGTLALRIRLFKPTKPAYPCLVYVKD